MILPSGNLQISNISQQDRGLYQCSAYNPALVRRMAASVVQKLTVVGKLLLHSLMSLLFMIQFFSATDGRVCRRASDEITKQFADKRRYYERNRRADRQTEKYTGRQSEKERDIQRERQTDRERQTEKERQTERLMLIQEPDEWRGVPAVLGDLWIPIHP